MSISDLVKEARFDILGDSVPEYLWSDKQLTRYANEAVQEACIRAPLIVKTYSIPVVATTAEYALSPYMRQINHAKMTLVEKPLAQSTDVALSMQYGYAWRDTAFTPTHYVRTKQKLRLYPVPIVNDTLFVTGSCIPDDDFDLDEDIDPGYNKGLLYWIAYKAYLLNDSDSGNKARADEFLGLFEGVFGRRRSAAFDTFAFNNPMYSTITSGRLC